MAGSISGQIITVKLPKTGCQGKMPNICGAKKICSMLGIQGAKATALRRADRNGGQVVAIHNSFLDLECKDHIKRSFTVAIE